MRHSSIQTFLAAAAAGCLGIIALIALNTHGVDVVWPLSIVAAAALLALGLSHRAGQP